MAAAADSDFRLSLSSFAAILVRILSWMILMYMASCSSRGDVDMIVQSGRRSARASASSSNLRSPFLMGVVRLSFPSWYSTPENAACIPPLQ